MNREPLNLINGKIITLNPTNPLIENITIKNGKIYTLKHGYPQFYTQILIEKNKPEIFIKSVMNDIEGISKISTCKNIEKFANQS